MIYFLFFKLKQMHCSPGFQAYLPYPWKAKLRAPPTHRKKCPFQKVSRATKRDRQRVSSDQTVQIPAVSASGCPFSSVVHGLGGSSDQMYGMQGMVPMHSMYWSEAVACLWIPGSPRALSDKVKGLLFLGGGGIPFSRTQSHPTF